MGHPPKPPHGDGMGMRHSLGDDSGSGYYKMGNGSVSHKRWSVPSFPGGQPPFLPPNQGLGGQGGGEPVWGWPKQGAGPPLPPPHGPGLAGNKAMGGSMNGQYSGFGDAMSAKPCGGKMGGSSLSLSDPWSPHWTVPPAGPGYPSPPPGPPRFNGISLPGPPASSSQGTQEKRGAGSKVKTGRSISCVTEPSWSSLSQEIGLEVGVAQGKDKGQGTVGAGGADLLQLMKSLDISSEHMQSLKVMLEHLT